MNKYLTNYYYSAVKKLLVELSLLDLGDIDVFRRLYGLYKELQAKRRAHA